MGTQAHACRPAASCFVSARLAHRAPGDLGALQSRPRKAVKYRTELFGVFVFPLVHVVMREKLRVPQQRLDTTLLELIHYAIPTIF